MSKMTRLRTQVSRISRLGSIKCHLIILVTFNMIKIHCSSKIIRCIVLLKKIKNSQQKKCHQKRESMRALLPCRALTAGAGLLCLLERLV